MMDAWLTELQRELDELAGAGLLRQLHAGAEPGKFITRGSSRLLNLGSNDYLGLATHPKLGEAAAQAAMTCGVGAGASRLAGGHLDIHQRVEAKFARFKHAEAALLCPAGYMANHAAITALARPGDLVCLDKLNHASLIDAARASGATVRVFPHLNLTRLQRLLERADANARKFIVTDSVFSMDGDTADLPALCDLADRYDAILIVDEAHATGVLGERGAGLGEAQGVAERIDVTVSTASKALGGLGGIITARQVVIDTIVNRARSFIYTTAIPPTQAAVVEAALDVLRDEPWRRQRLAAIAEQVKRSVCPSHDGVAKLLTPIIPVITGTPESALALSAHLASCGIFAPAIRPPTVAPGTARVRISLRADLDDAEVDLLLESLQSSPMRA